MPRIAGINIPENKRLVIGLGYVYGIGPTLAAKILKSQQLTHNPKFSELTPQQIDKLREVVEKDFTVEGDLRQQVNQNVRRLKEIGSYRGSRHTRRLPARGQRTKTNSRTVRGNVRKTAGSGKRKVDLK